MDERWRPIVGFEPFYDVSDQGRVRSLDRNDRLGRLHRSKVLTNARMGWRSNGKPNYMRIRLRDQNQKTHDIPIHWLVLEAFVGPRPEKFHACHNDGNPFNNHLSNVRWDTASANQRDKIRHGTMAHGERNGWSKLTRDVVENIWLSLEPARHIAERLSLHEETICKIRRGQSWQWFTESLPPQPARGRSGWRPRKARQAA